MKFFAFSDIHGNVAALRRVVRVSDAADILVCAGDLTNFGTNFKKLLSMLEKCDKELLFVPGNHEDGMNFEQLFSSFDFVTSIHGGSYQVGDVVFVGYGGGGFSFEDLRMERYFRRAKNWVDKRDKVVLVTHAPPYKTKVDKLPRVGHRGCVSVNRGIKLLRPFYAVAGHIHEAAGSRDTMGRTQVFNVGWKGRMLEI